MRLFLACLVAGLVLFPVVGNHIRDREQVAWCQQFETRYDFTREEAERYLDYCPHFDMNTNSEVPGRRVR